MLGWAGNLLTVELTKEKAKVEPLNTVLATNFLGGRGINAKLLFDEIKPKIDPLGPENILIFGTGPLTGTLCPSSGRFNVSAKSPITGIFGDSNAGGWWAPELKWAGYDHIVIHGRAERPVYLWIDDEHVEIRDASHLWGRDTWETQDMIREEHGDPGVQSVCIGHAGEGLVRYACIIHGLKRAAGRTGMGAVMGSKNLKAIAVRGTKGIEVARPDEFVEAAKEMHMRLRKSKFFEAYSKYGTLLLTMLLNESGRLSAMNWRSSCFENAEKLSGEVFLENYNVKNRACYGCPIHCSHYYVVRKGRYAGYGEGPEFVTVYALGPKCGVDDFEAVLKANELCNKYGIDSYEAGSAIAWAMDCYERGILTKKDTDGIDLRFGDHESMLTLLGKINRRESLGDLLAEGAVKAAQMTGRGSQRYVAHTHGLSWPSDSRVSKGFALCYATSTRGGDHLRGIPVAIEGVWRESSIDVAKLFGTDEAADPRSYEGKAVTVKWSQDLCAFVDAVEICKVMTHWQSLTAIGPSEIARMLSAATGMEFSDKTLMLAGERIYNVERMFNIREGITRREDAALSPPLLEPVPYGPTKGEKIDPKKFNKMLDGYYELRGWDERGIPTRRKLEKLGLGDIAENLET